MVSVASLALTLSV